ncbi:shikimate dehydrogenase [Candidatus Kinetoplastidibacterium crithidiae]|uniref:Shikimate dehydrogenase (NADP(+)) n=1 Tax=Candidatus Kinetoplastidibacterium crithidiae TCC036E TaxID=1208918 RepID=M1LUX6_9PROT|nr:shikimate dehydrogenase [Candidatus Kinetoplastibacterium crithidii]AFZ82901.1 shikimate 5-dehydrogenase [Candidatus Kinetoplastibacterium crithidii (ex Angomonas deanei ATCC 30255)]AGF47901.1 shikimate dehydrogenase [Candidatus Kinetoplastibacterium crithidii TCC036E]
MHIKDNVPCYGVVGNPIEHSKSPIIHNAFSIQTGISIKYDKILTSEEYFSKTIKDFFESNGLGLNITVPFKKKAFEIIPYNNISERAKLAKAINTIWKKDNNLYGCNTDGVGLLKDINRLNFNLHNANILIIGAGGAARGVLEPLILSKPSKIHIVNRTKINAENLLNDFIHSTTIKTNLKISYGGLSETNSEKPWDIVINTTASELNGESLDLPKLTFNPKKSLAYDIMYGSNKTSFLLKAENEGALQCVDGLGMLVEQAAESFFIWHGVRPETNKVLDEIRQLISS